MRILIQNDPRGGWRVRKEGAKRALRHFTTQEEAIEFGSGLARKNNAAIFRQTEKGLLRIPGLFAKNVLYADPHLWDDDMEN